MATLPAIPQVAVTQNPAMGLPGQVTEGFYANTILSAITETAVPAGVGMVTGATAQIAEPLLADYVQVATGTVAKSFRGVVIFDPMKAPTTAAPRTTIYAIGDVVELLHKGRIYVTTNQAVTVDADAYVVNTGADSGKFRTDNTNASAVTGGKFVRAISTTLAELELA